MITKCNDCRFYGSKKEIDDINGTCSLVAVYPLCHLGKEEQYRNHNIKIEINTDPPGSMILKDFICPFKKTYEQDISNELAEATTNDEIENIIIKENGFPYSAFIYEQNGIDIEEAVQQILNLDHSPKYLHITFKYMHQDEELLQKLVNMIEGHHTTIKYKLVINLDEYLDHFYDSYLAFRLNVHTPFIMMYFDNYILPTDLTTKVAYEIQKNLLSFPYITTSKNNEFMLFPWSILQEYIQFEGQYFIDKILETQCQTYKL